VELTRAELTPLLHSKLANPPARPPACQSAATLSLCIRRPAVRPDPGGRHEPNPAPTRSIEEAYGPPLSSRA
jgi:hypothetical protein